MPEKPQARKTKLGALLRQLPNLLTVARFPLALAMLFVSPLSVAFFTFYLLCGLTDVLDGWLARWLGVNGAFGARLDSASDFLLIVVLMVRLWPVITPSRPIAAWVAGIALARLEAAWTAKCRFGKIGFLHTRLNKLTGVVLAVYPFALLWQPLWSTVALCALASVSALEELAIEWTAEVWDADRKSLF